jgi:Protein of unknown function (DUF992)
MQKIAKLAVIAVMPVMVTGVAVAQERAQVGQLTCDISGGIGLVFGSQRTLNCTFTPSVPGPLEYYAGTLTKLGVDIGVTDGGGMVWLVYAPTSRPAGALSGRYGGAAAEATVGAGIGANVLIGGSNRTVELQPVSLQGQSGLNVAAGVAGIDLRWVR